MVAPNYQITMRSGPTPGKTYPFEVEEAHLGRDLANDITVSDPEISRRHARFFMRDESIFLEDLGSTNGTFLNGERVTSPQQLRSGDVITFGEHVVMVFERTAFDVESTIVAGQAPLVDEDMTPEPQVYQPVQDQEPYSEPLPVAEKVEVLPKEKPAKPVKAKKGKLPAWLVVLLVAIVVLTCVIAVTLYFMPASWWCAITFNALEGCPIP